MNMEFVLREVDRLFEENKPKEAETFLRNALEEARREEELGVCLQVLNELIGLYRQTSEREKLTQTIEEALQTAKVMELRETIWYGTTALNAANGYRSMGELELSEQYYDEAEAIYDKELNLNDMLFAGLYNNRALLEQELGNYLKAEEYLLKALQIVDANQSGFEIAVTYANLANTAVMGQDYDKAREYGQRAVFGFQKRHLFDAHYCAALSALGLCHYHEGEYEEARRLFEEGMTIVESTLGQNGQYLRLKENRDACLAKLEAEGITTGISGEKAREAMLAGEKAKDSGELQDKDEAKEEKPLKQTQDNSWQALGDLLQKELGKKDADAASTGFVSGIELCRQFYEECGKPMLEKEFPKYVGKMAVGLVGEGSDCMGFDDEFSRDHDWGPGFCIFIPEALSAQIGEKLRECYEKLPAEFHGHKRVNTAQGAKRLGVWTIEEFYQKYAGIHDDQGPDWRGLDDVSFLAATDGEVFADPEGRFTEIRERLKAGFPEEIRFLKLAEDAAKISQTGQYNYFRMLERGDRMTADGMLTECMKHVMRLWHHVCGAYCPHDKWLRKSTERLPGGAELLAMLGQIHGTLRMEAGEAKRTVEGLMENLCSFLVKTLYDESYVSDVDPYLDHQVEELIMKSGYASLSFAKLVDKVARTEFAAFDKVKNEGGRAYCQNDWPTFSVMRKSQYLTWDRTMLMQYLYDFERELRIGHNLITEKYGRMMESTAPEKYAELEQHFPEIPAEKKAVIEQIVALQMSMVEELSKDYPKVVANARNLHTYEDDTFDTSYETYLRGEISTYSDKMLQLYAGYVISCVKEGKNIARMTMENTAKLYGYQNLDEFQASIGV